MPKKKLSSDDALALVISGLNYIIGVTTMMDNEIMVSIYCMAYNHEKYIADAIESFLMQKTNFAYEILIHDDASTDRTAEIIKEYTSRYPDLMKPIYQTENQYSKGARPGKLNRERAKGKYMAICEGDDYWTDPFKLQKQVDYMEQHPECSLCVHAAHRIKPDKTKLNKGVRPNRGNKLFTTEEVILGGGGLFATNSIMYPSKFNYSRPYFFEIAPVGDYPLAIYLALQGTVYYIDEFMSAYRVGVPGSWTNRTLSNPEGLASHFDEIAHMLQEINEYTEYKYDTAINSTITHNKFTIMLAKGKFKEVKGGEFKHIYTSLSRNRKIMIFLKQYFPVITKVLIRVKRYFSK